MACTWANKEVGAGEELKGRNPSDSRSSNTRQSFRPSTCRISYHRICFFALDCRVLQVFPIISITCPWKGLATGGKMLRPSDTLTKTKMVASDSIRRKVLFRRLLKMLLLRPSDAQKTTIA